MIIQLTRTTTGEISTALLRARRSAGSPAMGMVLTLLVVCDEKEYESALQAAMEAGREHPARILLVVRAAGRVAALDAEVRIGEGTPGEVVVIRMRGPLAAHPASVVRPLLLPDSPVVIWWPGKTPANLAEDELAGLAQRRVTDAAAVKRPIVELKLRAETYHPGDTDLSWTRLTRWRALLAAALDQYPARIQAAAVEAERGSPSADLLAAWLQSCLKVKVTHKTTAGPGLTAVRMTTAAGDIAITRPDGLLASYAVPGQPERLVALKRRETTDLITEELRRMDADEVYAHALLALQDYTKTAPAPQTAAAKRATAKTASARKSTAKRTTAAKKAAPARRTTKTASKRPTTRRSAAKKAASAAEAATQPTAEQAAADQAVDQVDQVVEQPTSHVAEQPAEQTAEQAPANEGTT